MECLSTSVGITPPRASAAPRGAPRIGRWIGRFAIGCLALAMGPAAAVDQHQPYVPASDAVVLEHLPSHGDPRVRAFDALRRRRATAPHDPALAIQLARSYLDYGRATGDARYLGRAQAVVLPLLARRRPPEDALLVEATLLQSRHQFVESRRVLEALLQRDPDNTDAWLTLSAVAIVQGDMEEARRDCARLLTRADALVAAGCIAAHGTVTGHAREALQMLDALAPQAVGAPAGERAWLHGLMADAARYRGDDRRADREYRTALAFTPGDNFLVADYADFLLDQGRAGDALRLARDYPQSDTSFLRQVLAEQALGLPQARADAAAMASRFADLERRGDRRLYAREAARFALAVQQAPNLALQLARDDWAFQRAPEDARVLLEAALAAGKPAEARPVLDFIATTGLEEPEVRALAKRASLALGASPTAPERRP
jgi:Tfp pilus assembly protein PilF